MRDGAPVRREVVEGDEDLVMAVVRNYWQAWQFADEKLRGNTEVVIAAVRVYARVLDLADENHRGNAEVVMAAGRNVCGAVEFADVVAFTAVVPAQAFGEADVNNDGSASRCTPQVKRLVYLGDVLNALGALLLPDSSRGATTEREAESCRHDDKLGL